MIAARSPAIETLAEAAYEATRTPSFPAWRDTTDGYRADVRKAVLAMLRAGQAIKFLTINETQGSAS